MKRNLIALMVCLISFTIVSAAHATIYYVDRARPDDSGDGRSWATAKRTIQAGVALLSSGDTLKIASGTYPEAINIQSKSYSSLVTIETDDKSGNPGLVTLTGSASCSAGSAGIVVWNTSNVKINGRQANGFYPSQTGLTHAAVGGSGSDGAHRNITFQYLRAEGSYSGEGLIFMTGVNNGNIAYCNVNGNAPFLVAMQAGGDGDPSGAGGGSIHHNDIQGTPSEGYSAISLTRYDNTDVYSNYIHNVGNNAAVMRVRAGHDNRFYNNVIWIESGKTVVSLMQVRGESGCGVTGANDVSRNSFYNNTFILDGRTDMIVCSNENSHHNKFFNNLVIGNVGNEGFVSNLSSGNVCGGAANNELYNNVITGTLNKWFYSSKLQSTFSVASGGSNNQGTSFINLKGYKPFPFWGLSTSRDGASVPSLTTDYNGNSRANPPDVGAFECVELPPTPAPPKNLRIVQ